ncbi:MAG: DNA polymerase IV [bacterium]|nr:DNA polymerase IV [bacterium]
MPKAILHIDGDSFFASCEVSLDPRLKGKALITGQERGIVTAMSKEAKALGISRGMPIFKVRKMFPQVIIKSSDYRTYEIFAHRMFAIVRKYADVEEYSIDECFALLDSWNGEMVLEIKNELQSKLDVTFSLGLAPTKVLAKIASSTSKPDGLTILPPQQIDEFLKDVDIGKVWGIGPATSAELRRLGIKTALDLKLRSAEWGRGHLDKPILEIWHELNGVVVFEVNTSLADFSKSIQVTRTFTPPSSNKEFLFSELSHNIEKACVKIRREGQGSGRLAYFLKTQEFRYHRQEIELDLSVQTPEIILKKVRETFNSVFKPKLLYRATGVTLSRLVPQSQAQNDLFGLIRKNNDWETIYGVVDALEGRFGSHSVILGSSLMANKRRGGAIHRRLGIPYMGKVK